MNDRKLKQGDIIKTNFNPKIGHEQTGYRPALVVSCGLYNNAVNLAVLCPITNTNRPFPFHIPLDERTTTSGVVLCEQVKATNLDECGYVFVERIPKDLLLRVLNIIRQEFDFDNQYDEDASTGDELKIDSELKSAIEVAVDRGSVSTSLLQRKLRIGYAKAASMIDKMGKMNILEPTEGSSMHKVLITKQDFIKMTEN